ncbi:MAG: hypothetical protein PHQ25_03095 [Acidobacteriota bacterium]|nr:hypothetical protein [Acidobacteriota bacterium]MDW3228918.1 hypothetical protein [Acidobacteriota bacterium]
MSEIVDPGKKPISIIQEIESQLEDYLRRQREEIEKALEEKIQKEREQARQQLLEIEQAVKKEWQSLEEYGNVWQEFEEKRDQILVKIREYLQRIFDRQQQIESLAKETSEDIKTINHLEDQLEEMRHKSMEQAAFLKKRLEEKFGLRTERPEPAEVGADRIDLTPELEKLKKVKELLILEKGIPVQEPAEVNKEERIEPEAEESPKAELAEQEQPEQKAVETNQVKPEELSLEAKLAEEIRKNIVQKLGNLEEVVEKLPEDLSSVEEKETLKEISPGELQEFYQQEPANGSVQIGYYQKDKKYILEAEELLIRMKESVEEAKKLNHKLTLVSGAKEQFYLKQELISLQEELRHYLQKVLAMVGKQKFRFPALTMEIINENTLKELSDLLSVQNWNLSEDLNLFDQKLIELTASFKTRATPASIYFAALKKELEA